GSLICAPIALASTKPPAAIRSSTENHAANPALHAPALSDREIPLNETLAVYHGRKLSMNAKPPAPMTTQSRGDPLFGSNSAISIRLPIGPRHRSRARYRANRHERTLRHEVCAGGKPGLPGGAADRNTQDARRPPAVTLAGIPGTEGD